MLYRLKVTAEKSRAGRAAQVAAAKRRYAHAGLPWDLDALIRKLTPGRSFIDVGGMWGINGEDGFTALRAGATRVTCADMFRTEEFDAKVAAADGAVEFVLAEASAPSLPAAVGVVDVVWCTGVLYHHPNPFAMVANLRRICGSYLVLETLGIPEIWGVPNGAVYFPMTSAQDRKLWTTASTRRKDRLAVTADYSAGDGWANNFWGLSPSGLESLLRSTGFEVDAWGASPKGIFRWMFVCHPVAHKFVDVPEEFAELAAPFAGPSPTT